MTLLEHPEKIVLLSVVLLIATGLVFIYSVSEPFSYARELSGSYYFLKQLSWSVIAMIAMFVCAKINYRKFSRLSPLLVLCSLVFLVAVLFMPAQQGVHRWLGYGMIRFQPSEVFKLSLLIYLTFVLVDKKDKPKELKKSVPHFIVVLLGLLLIARQPDLGTMMMIFISTAALLFLIGLKVRYLVIGGTLILLMGAIVVFGRGYEKDRIDDYYAALKNPLEREGEGALSRGYYQIRQSLISIGSGGIGGCGLGGGGQKNLFLPAPHTDFIFSASAEEGGFLLCVFLLGLYFMLLLGAFKIAGNSADFQGYLLASGLGLMLALQAMINIGVALGLLPITGITLPFFSYGGSSLVISCASAGLILSVARYGAIPRIKLVRAR
jgi:cell division protein FtsW